ncbi:MAG: MYXO-CTERM sorting domain-containing protein [Polyangiaceae bacterium]
MRGFVFAALASGSLMFGCGVERESPIVAEEGRVDVAHAPKAGASGASLATEARLVPRATSAGVELGADAVLDVKFAEDATRVHVGAVDFGLRLAAIGRARGERESLGVAPARIEGASVERTPARGVDEWWRATPEGLEHGVTIDERPEGDGDLEVELALDGDVVAHVIDRGGVALATSAGARFGRYAGLAVIDADAREVPAHLEAEDHVIRIVVDDAGARYPLLIDPVVSIEEQVLGVPNSGSYSMSGAIVAMDGTGSRIAVGRDNAVEILVRSGDTWASEQTLSGAYQEGLGISVSFSAAGDRLAVGMSNINANFPGLVRFFVRNGSTWSLEGQVNNPAPAAYDLFGRSVALDATGTRAVVGTPNDDPNGGTDVGSAWVLVRDGSTWSIESELVWTTPFLDARFGSSVAINGDGSVAVVGAPLFSPSGSGGVFVFRRSGTTWTEEGPLPTQGIGDEHCGQSVGVNASGDRVVFGCPDSSEGGASVCFYDGSTWQFEAQLRDPIAGPGDKAGASVSISADGTIALVGEPKNDQAGLAAGAVNAYHRSKGNWSHHLRLPFANNGNADNAGAGVAIAGDGSHSATGMPGDDVLGAYSGSLRVHTLSVVGSADGTACTDASDCYNGFCVDGVCCDGPCGGGNPDDCMVCSAAAGGSVDGTCGPYAATDSHVCRAAVDLCDAVERCSSTSLECPADVASAVGTVCRDAADACDAVESCDGSSFGCPADVVATAGTVCRAAADGCDFDETCDGTASACPADVTQPDGASCDDGSTCTTGDQCVSGACVGTAPADADCCSVDSDCDDGDACTTDACAAGTCQHTTLDTCGGDDGGGDDDGCSCRASGAGGGAGVMVLLGLAVLGLGRRRVRARAV